jgi:hypothetical protein
MQLCTQNRTGYVYIACLGVYHCHGLRIYLQGETHVPSLAPWICLVMRVLCTQVKLTTVVTAIGGLVLSVSAQSRSASVEGFL